MDMLATGIPAALVEAAERQLRIDLAAAFRLAVFFDWHESVGNHFSAALSDDGKRFLLNPKWQHFSTIRASDLLRLDADDEGALSRDNAPDASAWCIHGALHGAVPRARVVLHCHPPYATALCGLQNPTIQPIDQNTARFFNRVAIDTGFDGIADEQAEGLRLAAALGDNDVMLMGNHGLTVIGQSVAQAFEALYFMERACRTMVLAYATGQPLNVMPEALAEKTARGWDAYAGMADAHFSQLKNMLDKSDPSYRD
ncbi:MAG: class II aldolase/adducin family protein [Burkholderiaceae bacterium]